MAPLVPTVTNITSDVATFNAAGILAALHIHFNTTSTQWSVVDAQTTTNTGDEGINVAPVAVSETFSVNLRNKASGNIITVGVDPEGTITSAGDSTPTTPTGTGARWSGEADWDVTATDAGTVASGSEVFVVETDDHFAVFIGNSVNTTASSNVCCAGRIVLPDPVTTDGSISGLGVLVGKPDAENGSTGDWITQSGNSLLEHSNGNWYSPFSLSQASTQHAQNGVSFSSVLRLAPLVAYVENANTCQAVGTYKYIRLAGLASPKVQRGSTSSNQSWIHIDSGTTSEYITYIWDKRVTPL